MLGFETPDPTAVAGRLDEIRERTRELVAALDWETLRRQQIPILSPMVWDLGHIGNFEEIWLSQQLAELPPLRERYQTMFDALLNPRPTRDALPLPSRVELDDYLDHVRRQTVAVLGRDDLDPGLTDGGFVYEMVAQHEEQHQETLLQAMQVLDDPPYRPTRRRAQPEAPDIDAESLVEIPGGELLMGFEGPGFAYDNERGRHRVDLDTFRIDRFPVTNGRFAAFVDDGGYRRRELWSPAGWAWREEDDAESPRNWQRTARGWQVRYMDRVLEDPVDRPVVHVCHHEAEAFCRWAGRRLPTEAEWEKAALWDPDAQRQRVHPWGDDPATPERANLDQMAFAPATIGSYPDGASAYGVEQMIGDVWEWTATDFTAYPGFEAFPYNEYSKVFFGHEYKVLRGGSWATRPAVARGTFRNWDYPIRRQIFAGFRCVEAT